MTAKLHFVRRARKTHRDNGSVIRKGSPYWWFAFCTGGRWSRPIRSLTRPRRSALTRSEFLKAIWDAEDDLAGAVTAFRNGGDIADLVTAVSSAADAVREAGAACLEKAANMPLSLQGGPTGELLQERAEACEALASELEGAAASVEGVDVGEVEDEDGVRADGSAVEEAASFVEAVSWEVG